MIFPVTTAGAGALNAHATKTVEYGSASAHRGATAVSTPAKGVNTSATLGLGGPLASPMQALLPIGLSILGVFIGGPIGAIAGGLLGVFLIAKQNPK